MRNPAILLLIIAICCALFFLTRYNHFSSSERIYFSTGGFGKIFEVQSGVFFEVGKMLKEHGLKPSVPKSLSNLKNFKKLVMFDLFLHRLNKLKQYPSKKLILFLWEPPSVISHNYDKSLHQRFSKIFTWDDTLVDNIKYFKFYYPDLQPMLESKKSFNDKKLLCMISANKSSSHPNELYSERKKIIDYFESRQEEGFDFYGKGWESIYKNYKGAPDSKAVMQNYKFAITYENIAHLQGYITEKIFDAFHYGSVPIYLGAENVQSYIPKNCYIDRRDFQTDAELIAYLKSMPEEEHGRYIESIKQFLDSEKGALFSKDNFVKTMKRALEIL